MDEFNVANLQAVGVQGPDIIVMFPRPRMSKAEAILHAAWLVALADDNDEFAYVLDKVRNT